MEFINRMRKDKKGFTLVEIIVVLVILAILAAFTIPSMLGFIGDARAKAYLAEAREVYTAAQATATEYSAKYTYTDGSLGTALSSDAVQAQSAAPTLGTVDDTHTIASVTGTYNSELASYQMNKYLIKDLAISDVAWAASPNSTTYTHGQSAWLVTVGDATSAETKALKTGKVTSVVYIKDGYKTTVYGDGKDPLTEKL